MIRLFVGFDQDEAMAFSVFAHSVHRHASVPVTIAPLMLSQLAGMFQRARDPLQSTEFAFTRFLVPALCDYQGWALYADGDMLCRADLAGLWALRDPKCVLQVVQHQHVPAEASKFLGRPQSAYARKNWSSVMLFNNARCRALSPELVMSAPGLHLHQFGWVAHGYEIGALPPEWNHLVGVSEPDPEAKIAHFTLGMPVWHGYRECEHAAEWRAERDRVLAHKGRSLLEPQEVA